MTDKELKKLSRSDLLELLLVQTKENEHLKQKLQAAEKALEERQLRLVAVGTLAEAMLEVNHVMDAAQAAADQYLENIASMEAETKARCQQMLETARQQAQRLLDDANQKPKGDQN